MMLNLVRPTYFVPIHGEYRHLVKHKQLAQQVGLPPENCFIVENGDAVTFVDGRAAVHKQAETGRVFVDGKGVGDVCDLVLRDRRHLSEDGMVLVTLVINKEHREVLNGPDVVTAASSWKKPSRRSWKGPGASSSICWSATRRKGR